MTMESAVQTLPDFNRWHFSKGSLGSASQSDSASEVVKVSMGDCLILLLIISITTSDRSAVLVASCGMVISLRSLGGGTAARL